MPFDRPISSLREREREREDDEMCKNTEAYLVLFLKLPYSGINMWLVGAGVAWGILLSRNRCGSVCITLFSSYYYFRRPLFSSLPTLLGKQLSPERDAVISISS